MNVFLYFLQTFTINFYFQCLIGHGQVVMCCLIRTPEMIVAFWVNKPLLNTRNVEQTKMYICTLKNIYSSRYLDALLYKLELDKHWKNAGLYTLATKE